VSLPRRMGQLPPSATWLRIPCMRLGLLRDCARPSGAGFVLSLASREARGATAPQTPPAAASRVSGVVETRERPAHDLQGSWTPRRSRAPPRHRRRAPAGARRPLPAVWAPSGSASAARGPPRPGGRESTQRARNPRTAPPQRPVVAGRRAGLVVVPETDVSGAACRGPDARGRGMTGERAILLASHGQQIECTPRTWDSSRAWGRWTRRRSSQQSSSASSDTLPGGRRRWAFSRASVLPPPNSGRSIRRGDTTASTDSTTYNFRSCLALATA